jgi:hypothetical protein
MWRLIKQAHLNPETEVFMLSLARYSRSTLVTILFGFVGSLSACADESGSPTAPRPSINQASADAASSGDVRPAEEHLFALAREVPGFGGYFLDNNGVLVAYVKDLKNQELVRARVEQVRGRLAAAQIRGVSVRQGQFDFPSLAHWRDLVSSQILGVVSGVVMSDADEAANRVTIGIDEKKNPAVRGAVLGNLKRLGIPIDAIRFLNTEAMRPDVNQDLGDVPSPVVAGYRIHAPGGCTLGPIVLHDGSPAAFTNSHCTSAMYALDGSALKTTDNAIIGFETADPGANCGVACRSSDAALFTLSGGVSSDYGRIARTINASGSWGIAGSLSIDQSNPKWDVIAVAAPSEVVPGMYLVKTGATTGTTSGFVSNTCSDEGDNGFVRKCSIISSYYAAGGDSGSPVYTYMPGTGALKLVAIHWGSDSVGHSTVSSYYSSAMAEIGGSFVSTRPAPLSAYVTGPTDVKSDPSCRLTYTVVVSGGSGSYAFSAWQPYTTGIVYDDSGDTMTASFPNPPEGQSVGVLVSDSGTGEQLQAGLDITSGPSGMWCNN